MPLRNLTLLVFPVLLQMALTLSLKAETRAKGASEKTPVEIGAVIGDLEFKDIRYLPRSLDELGKHKAYVFVFANTTCPLVQRYLPRLKALDEEYGKLGVQFVSVNVSPGDTIRDMASHALRSGALFPFVKDIDGQCARRLGVERTPEVAVLDENHRLVYRGRIDDQYRLGGALPKPRRHDLEEALKDVLAGRPVAVATTPVDGCEITFPILNKRVDTKINFAEDVAPLIQRHCAGCHRPRTSAPFSLLTFDDVSSQAEMIEEVVSEERMPPWYASPEHGEFLNAPTITADDRRAIVEWVRGGTPPGDLSKIPPAEQTESPKWQIGEPDLVLKMIAPHTIPAEGFIPYKYIVFPYVFLRDTWVEAFEILPDNRSVVHHSNMAYASKGQKPGRGTFITGYVPGGQAMDLAVFDNNVAFRLPALSVLGLQIHYTTTGQPEKCSFSVGIRYAKRDVEKQLRFRLADPRRFQIPPRHPAYAVRQSFTLPSDVSLLGMFAHMHYRGKDMTFLAHRPDGQTETLLEIPNFNFDWQMSYAIEPGKKRLPKGTRLEAIAHYDNSTFNPYNPDPDKQIAYGLQSVDEMMNGYMFFTIDSEMLRLRIDPKTGWVLPPNSKKDSPPGTETK